MLEDMIMCAHVQQLWSSIHICGHSIISIFTIFMEHCICTKCVMMFLSLVIEQYIVYIVLNIVNIEIFETKKKDLKTFYKNLIPFYVRDLSMDSFSVSTGWQRPWSPFPVGTQERLQSFCILVFWYLHVHSSKSDVLDAAFMKVLTWKGIFRFKFCLWGSKSKPIWRTVELVSKL